MVDPIRVEYLGEKQKGLAVTLTLLFFGADETNRTSDLLITNQLLYRLSYISEARNFIKERSQQEVEITLLFEIGIALHAIHPTLRVDLESST